MKTAYLSENNVLFDKLRGNYLEAKEEFLNLLHGQMPASYFAFDTRFILTAAMTVSFDKKMIKSKATKSCYIRLVKISDLWFAYESLLNIAYEQSFFADKTAKTNAIKDKEASEVFALDDLIHNCNNVLNNQCLNDADKNKKIQDYLTVLIQSTSSNQTATLTKALASVRSKKDLGIQELIGLIYEIRNLFVTKGDTSVAKIKNLDLAKSMFEILYDFLLLTCIKVATKLIYNKINELSK